MTPQLSSQFSALTAGQQVDSIGDIPGLRAHFVELRNSFAPIYQQASGHKDVVQQEHDAHYTTLGIREKWLRGWLGGNKDAVRKKDNLKVKLKEISELHEQMGLWMYQVKLDCKDRVKGLVRAADPQFDILCKEAEKVSATASRTGSLLHEINEVLSAIENSRQADREMENANEENMGSATQKAENAYDRAVALVKAWPQTVKDYQRDMMDLEMSSADIFPASRQTTLAEDITQSLMDAFGLGQRKSGLEKAKPEMDAYQARIEAYHRRLSQASQDLYDRVDERVCAEWGLDETVESESPAEQAGVEVEV
jgi:hypothetical protein